MSDMDQAVAIIRKHSRSENLCFLFTVSPVPLTAIYSDNHVQVAISYSKSVLRSVAGDLVDRVGNAAYFPSYEIVTAPTSRGIFFEGSMRSVNPAGVEIIMKTFLKRHGLLNHAAVQAAAHTNPSASLSHNVVTEDDVVCEEALLDAFAPR